MLARFEIDDLLRDAVRRSPRLRAQEVVEVAGVVWPVSTDVEAERAAEAMVVAGVGATPILYRRHDGSLDLTDPFDPVFLVLL